MLYINIDKTIMLTATISLYYFILHMKQSEGRKDYDHKTKCRDKAL